MLRTPLPAVDDLDAGVADFVNLLREHGVETFESCDGSPGHSCAEPLVRFFGQREEGFRALAVALEHGFPVSTIRRFWDINDGEPCGPHWEMTLRVPKRPSGTPDTTVGLLSRSGDAPA